MDRIVEAKKLVCLLGLIIATPFFLSARRMELQFVVVTGKVCDPGSMKPLPGIEVAWKDHKTRSDSAGHYQIKVPVGVRELSFSASARPAVRKLLIVRQPDLPVALDVLLPGASTEARQVLALDRGSRLTPNGKDLESDIPADSTISLSDEYGNHDQLLTLETQGTRVHSPVWWNSGAILFGKEAVLHRKEDEKFLGVFQYELSSGKAQQIVSQVRIHFLDKSPRHDAIVAASQNDLYVIDSPSKSAETLQHIYSLGPNKGFILSVAWGPDDRIYFTVEESVKIDSQHSLPKSRIASIRSDGTDLEPDWAADTRYSYRYAVCGSGEGIFFSRFTLDGKEQTVWKRNTDEGRTGKVLDAALRMVPSDSKSNRLYYIYQQDLHLKDFTSGSDLVIVNSVEEASYLH